jgi:hypothetical protein
MFDVNRDKADGSGVSNDLGGEFLELLIFIGDHLGFCKVFHWLRDEAPRNATIRELSLRSDRYLEDIGASARRCNQDGEVVHLPWRRPVALVMRGWRWLPRYCPSISRRAAMRFLVGGRGVPSHRPTICSVPD